MGNKKSVNLEDWENGWAENNGWHAKNTDEGFTLLVEYVPHMCATVFDWEGFIVDEKKFLFSMNEMVGKLWCEKVYRDAKEEKTWATAEKEVEASE